MKAAIVTLAIGDAYLNRWRAHCESGWSRYAERHGLELIVIDKPLDQTFRAAARSPAWQKCLVLRPDIAGSFDRIIWIDSDVLINDRAPSIAEGVPRKIGATDEHVFPLQQVRRDMFMLLKQQAEGVNPGLAKTWATILIPRTGMPPGVCRAVGDQSCRPACWCLHPSITASSWSTSTTVMKTVAANR